MKITIDLTETVACSNETRNKFVISILKTDILNDRSQMNNHRIGVKFGMYASPFAANVNHFVIREEVQDGGSCEREMERVDSKQIVPGVYIIFSASSCTVLTACTVYS